MRPCEDCGLPEPVPSVLQATEPEQPLVLWKGVIHRRATADSVADETADGEVRLIWRRSFGLEWTVDTSGAADLWRHHDFGRSAKELGFEFGGAVTYLPIEYYDRGRGWSNGGNLGSAETNLRELRASLANFPTIHNNSYLHDHNSGSTWLGHWQVEAAGWLITIDGTLDHQAQFARAKEDQTYALTHSVRVMRPSGETFTPAEADDVLDGLGYALSFAAGYWVGLILPTGFDDSDHPVWTQWGAPHVGRARRGGGWWIDFRPEDLADYLTRFLGQWDRPDPTTPLRFAVTSSIVSHETGFVEQRLIAAVAALDHLSWTDEVLGMGMDEMEWRKRGDKRLRRLLERTSVTCAYSRDPHSAALTEYGKVRSYHDLAKVVFEVRNRITHPKPDDNIYASRDVLLEAWLHASYWLELVILHRLGFSGRVRNRTIRNGGVGDSERVPWDNNLGTEEDAHAIGEPE